MALSFNHATKLIGVPQADAAPLTMQVLLNAIREEEASERGITHDAIATAAGKDDLGGGVLTGITVNLLSSWKLDFAAGAYQATVDGGNLSDALARINNTGNPQVLVRASAAATIATVSTGSGLSVEESAKLMSLPSAATTAAAVAAAAVTTPIHADVRLVTGAEITGTGSDADPWGPA